MVNKIKRFFRAIGKPTSGSASHSNNGFPILSDNQFFHPHEQLQQQQQQQRSGGGSSSSQSFANSPLDNATGMPIMMMRTAAEGSGSSADSATATSLYRNGGGDGIRWSLLLPRIPRLVAEATANTTPAGAATSGGADDDNVELTMLLEMLTQMAPKEAQTQIRQFYMGDASNTQASASTSSSSASSSSTPTAIVGSEQRKVFRQCRRALLLCWKFIVAQLNDESARLSTELKNTYFLLIGLIAERVEFNLSADGSALSTHTTSKNQSTRQQQQQQQQQSTPSGHMMGWTAHSPVAATPPPLASTIDLSLDPSTSSSSSSQPSDESVDGERDLYLYRCLLVATFKYVVENIEGAKASRRSWITIAELQFFAKVLAICFFRVPVLQRLVLDQIYFTYRQKRWVNTTTAAASAAGPAAAANGSSTQPENRAHRRRSSSRLGTGVTFTGSLNRWSEFEGHVLSEPTGDGDDPNDDGTNESNSLSDKQQTPAPPAPPSRAAVDKFKRTNPTLFRWTRYAPFLPPYADSDVFRMNDAMKLSWLEKLSHDGEFFAVFMSYYTHHANVCSINEPLWSVLPGYTLLIRVALLLLKETSWLKWLHIRDNMLHMFDSPSTARDAARRAEPFEIRSVRGIRAVLDSVEQWLGNRDLLESCTLAVLECTNVLDTRCMSFCLSRCEAWLLAATKLVVTDTEQLVARLPASFTGQTFALSLRLMLSSESFETLTRTLQFLYNCIEAMDGELRQHVLKVLVQRHMSLFLHWHDDVRSYYHHLLVYRVIRVNRYFLDSPIDHLLLGRHAVLQIENSLNGNSAGSSNASGFDDFDDHLGTENIHSPYASNDKYSSSGGTTSSASPFQISAAEFSALRTEQALWRAFDACIGAICVHERRNAKDGNRRYQYELQCARSRAIAFQKLNREPIDENAPKSSVNESLPGGKPWLELDLLDDELRREPPYYLRYLPAEEVSSIEELRRLASTLRYPPELQVYAAVSLRHYSDLLRKYYEELSRNRFVEAPPLGFQ